MQTAGTIATELANLTRESLTGVGVFDTLMRTVKIHLQDEYDAQRITGHEYATVYLGALNAVLQTSAQFLVNVANAARIDAEIIAMQANTANDNSRTANEIAKTAAEILALEAGTDNSTRKTDSEILLMAGQLTNDTTRTTNDTAKTTAEVDSLEARTANETLKIAEDITASQNQTVNTTNKINAEISLMTTQKNNDTTRTVNDTTRTTNEATKVTAEIDALTTRTAAEVKLLGQKAATEVAQTANTIPAGVGLAPGEVAGIVGAQKSLYTAQATGFNRDAEQKLLKTLSDTWSIQASAGTAVQPGNAGFGEFQILDVVNAARAGIGLAPTAAPPP
jgi:hypothetical protein